MLILLRLQSTDITGHLPEHLPFLRVNRSSQLHTDNVLHVLRKRVDIILPSKRIARRVKSFEGPMQGMTTQYLEGAAR
jgi:hypothetical protein